MPPKVKTFSIMTTSSNPALNRRAFLRHLGLTMGAAWGTSQVALQGASSWPLYRISLAQWSLNRHFFKRVTPHFDPLDFAAIARSHDIEAVEYVNQFFMDKATDASYLAELKKRAREEGVKSVLIMIDREGDLGDPDKARRMKAVENHHKWVDAAKTLGCHSIRVNARSSAKLGYEEQMNLAADGLAALNEYGAAQGIGVIVENHGGLSSNGAWLMGVMRKVNHPNCGTLPDFGNFGIDREKDEWYDRYQGVTEMMPFAKAVSAKAHVWDDKEPFVTHDKWGKQTDFLKMMRIVLNAGYRGFVGIESEGDGDQVQGVKDTRDVLVRVREVLTKEYRPA